MSRCAKCDGETRIVVVKTRTYEEAGLPRVHLRDVEVRECVSCGASALRLPNIEGLHRTIAVAFATRLTSRLFSDEIRFLRKYLGLSREDFARAIGVTEDEVNAVETGAERMGLRNEIQLRVMVLTRGPVQDYKFGVGREPTVRYRKDRSRWESAAHP